MPVRIAGTALAKASVHNSKSDSLASILGGGCDWRRDKTEYEELLSLGGGCGQSMYIFEEASSRPKSGLARRTSSRHEKISLHADKQSLVSAQDARPGRQACDIDDRRRAWSVVGHASINEMRSKVQR